MGNRFTLHPTLPATRNTHEPQTPIVYFPTMATFNINSDLARSASLNLMTHPGSSPCCWTEGVDLCKLSFRAHHLAAGPSNESFIQDGSMDYFGEESDLKVSSQFPWVLRIQFLFQLWQTCVEQIWGIFYFEILVILVYVLKLHRRADLIVKWLGQFQQAILNQKMMIWLILTKERKIIFSVRFVLIIVSLLSIGEACSFDFPTSGWMTSLGSREGRDECLQCSAEMGFNAVLERCFSFLYHTVFAILHSAVTLYELSLV